ncbi:hypothetical protein [Planococcus salinarum]|uniref:hypothetical protein n=1 Tax=Planococcus salinarum TaxID=622695 RepID=UPI001E4C6449|nr:hypothetical protein [Planococcus salinarum]
MKRISIFIILLLVLGGCSNSGIYEFSGTTDNWDVFYMVDVTNDDEQKATGTLKYIGDGPMPETVDYKIGTTLTKMGQTGTPLTDGKGNIGSGCEGCGTFQEDDELEMEIMWDGQTEKLILTTIK